MIYHVTARFRTDTAAVFLAKLTGETVSSQRPDGPEIVAAMKRAVVNQEGQVEWSEMCFCETPLAHERATVLDLHFEDIVTEPIDAHKSFEGHPFMEHLRALSSSAP